MRTRSSACFPSSTRSCTTWRRGIWSASVPAIASSRRRSSMSCVCACSGGIESPGKNRGHFFGVSAGMMRRVLVDIARRRRAERRGGPDAVRVPLDGVDMPASEPCADILAVDFALQRLAAEDARKARVVELRFFGGLSIDETAEALEVSPRTVHSDWSFARAWLYRTLTAAHGD